MFLNFSHLDLIKCFKYGRLFCNFFPFCWIHYSSIFVLVFNFFFILIIYSCTLHSGFNLISVIYYLCTLFVYLCISPFLFVICFLVAFLSRFDFSYSTINFRSYLSWKSSALHSHLLSSSLLLFLAFNLFIIFRKSSLCDKLQSS